MTGVEFHFNAPDKVAYACRLLRKASATGARLVVTGDAAMLRDLDLQLWTFSPLEFIPHALQPGSPEQVLAASPVVLTPTPRGAPHQEVLVNLGTQVPAGFEQFERLIEVVTQDDGDRQLARGRWKHYADRGYGIKRHDLALKDGR